MAAMAASVCSCSFQCPGGMAEASSAGRRTTRVGESTVRTANFLRVASASLVQQKEHMGKSLRFTALPAEAQQYSKASGLKVEAAKRINTGRSFALSSTLVVAEDKTEEAKALCEQILKWGEAKRKEKGSGVQAFDCNADPFEKTTYHFWELYESFTIMNDVRSSPEHTEFMNNVRPLLVKPVGLAAYEYKDGQIGHMLNPIGPKGEGGLDDATGQSGTKQQSSSIGQGLGEMEEDVGSKAWGLDKILAKVRGEDKEAGWSFKTLFGSVDSEAKK